MNSHPGPGLAQSRKDNSNRPVASGRRWIGCSITLLMFFSLMFLTRPARTSDETLQALSFSPTPYSVSPNAQPYRVTSFNFSGTPYLAVTMNSSAKVSVFTANANGTFGAATDYLLPNNSKPQGVVVG